MRPTSLPALALALTLCTLTTLSAAPAAAFCGFYVSGGDATLFNDATQVALMRQGTQTVLSMQNNYKGPAKAFAMVVPVPVVLQQDDVKTLPREVFARLDAYSAPRLVEYWERDPCYEPPSREQNNYYEPDMASFTSDFGSEPTDPQPVVVEAQFTVGEYEVVVLSATEASGLETWLKDNAYNIPEGAAPIFKSYIQQGMYFFVAKVDPAKVTYRQGEAILSPLRFSYTSEDFSLPIRLGLVNSSGTQDLIITILGNSRYEAANYPNATIPTNLEVSAEVKGSFGAFYTKLFDQTLTKNPGAVVTEHVWTIPASSFGPDSSHACDPCPPDAPNVLPDHLLTLGGDILSDQQSALSQDWIFTRLHMRYGAGGLDEDITLRAVEPLVGGREQYPEPGVIEPTQLNSFINQFQGRYIIRNHWTGAVSCDYPQYGVWGGPWNGVWSPTAVAPGPNQGGTIQGTSASLEQLIRQDVPEADIVTQNPAPQVRESIPRPPVDPQNTNQGTTSGPANSSDSGCANTAGGSAPVGLGLFAALGLALGVRRQRRGR